MNRADDLTQLLALEPHPEGGAYRRIYRSRLEVTAFEPPEQRAALTGIYYLLRQGEFSCLHCITSDEAWHFYEGAPLDLILVAPDFSSYEVRHLGVVAANRQPAVVVPAGYWQAARCSGDYALVGCSVAPGFEFRSFRMLREEPALAKEFRRKWPQLADLIGAKDGD